MALSLANAKKAKKIAPRTTSCSDATKPWAPPQWSCYNQISADNSAPLGQAELFRVRQMGLDFNAPNQIPWPSLLDSASVWHWLNTLKQEFMPKHKKPASDKL